MRKANFWAEYVAHLFASLQCALHFFKSSVFKEKLDCHCAVLSYFFYNNIDVGLVSQQGFFSTFGIINCDWIAMIFLAMFSFGIIGIAVASSVARLQELSCYGYFVVVFVIATCSYPNE